MYVYLLQGAQSGEDWGRQRRQFVAGKVKVPVGRREETVRLALFRHRSTFACTSGRVRECECVSPVQVRDYLEHERQRSQVSEMQGICKYC